MHRASGVLLPITSLPSPGGIGDLGVQAYRFIDRLRMAEQRYWQVLPLNPPSSHDGESPYFSSSAFAGSPLMISTELLADDGLLPLSRVATLDAPGPVVDYDRVRTVRYPLLEEAHRTFVAGGRSEAYRTFCERESHWLDDYVLFTVIKRHQEGTSWAQWPRALRDRRADELHHVMARHEQECDKERFYQYLFFSQWARLRAYAHEHGIEVIGDIPIYVSYESADVWAHPEFFDLDRDRKPLSVSGVPPDYFSETGQLWNNPVYRWDELKRDGYGFWVRRMRAMFERFDVVRIDHFRGLVQYWAVPAGRDNAMVGVWRDVPTQDFFDTMRKQFPAFPVIAEDLGYITPDVRTAMAENGFPGMRVLMFAFGGDDPSNPHLPHNHERNAVVYTGTHDNNTIRGWLEEDVTDAELKHLGAYLGRPLSISKCCWELVRLASMSVADVCILPFQDLLTLDGSARINDPAKNKGNWRWRSTLEQMDRLACEELAEMARIFGRIPPSPSASGPLVRT